jgi:hypothetical protein
MPLSNIESTLFESVEFCLALLGTLPVPVYLVTNEDKIVTLSSQSCSEGKNLNICCAHNPNSADSAWGMKTSGCSFCKIVTKVRQHGTKMCEKTTWMAYTNGEERELTVRIHALPIKISDQDLIIVAVEDITELEILKGLLPICVSCNKIHDTKANEWTRIDEYITDNSAAKFSHGMCPVCAKDMLDELDGK